ncbi:MAG: TonB-dependent receptor [Crocinitomicaceae bacterium]|nr:TonB-dependent receptor [Crocinitomicaceae bacterium]
MKTSYKLMFWAAIFFLPVFSYSQYAFVGTVRNYFSGESIPSAKVVLTNSYHRTLTDLNGEFEFTLIKNGTYYVEVSSPGYTTMNDTIIINGKDVALNYSLEELSYMSDEIVITSTRADDYTPTTFTNMSSQKIEKLNYGQDIPYLFNLTPSVVITSDAGTGIGYTGIRIRGVDPTRTNVTINGIPVNDSESHGTWWVNMPDLASSIENVQIQRGVGTSANGAASFGASINIKTNEVNKNPYAEISTSYGSFNTLKGTIRLGSGLINNKFTLDARLSKINSDGYIDRAYSDLSSYYISGAWLGKKSVLRLTHFSGKETTYQSWWGTPQAVVSGNQDSILTHYYNNPWSYSNPQDSANLFSSGRTYNYYTYENEVDNYQQDHYQLHYSQQLTENIDLLIAGHYTYGRGYYEQFRKNDDFSSYGISPLILTGDTITSGDFIRRRWLDNQFYGGVFSLNYKSKSALI